MLRHNVLKPRACQVHRFERRRGPVLQQRENRRPDVGGTDGGDART